MCKINFFYLFVATVFSVKAQISCNVNDTPVNFGSAHARCLALANGSYMPTMKELTIVCDNTMLNGNYWIANGMISIGNNSNINAFVFRPNTENFITEYLSDQTFGSVCVSSTISPTPPPVTTYNIEDNRQLFVDNRLIKESTGDLTFELQKPEVKEVVIIGNEPWEGNLVAYFKVFEDNGIYRMYYRCWHQNIFGGNHPTISPHDEFTCYAESTDGINWTKPNLGQHEFNGNTNNNIILMEGVNANGYRISHNFNPFINNNPNALADTKYLAIGGAINQNINNRGMQVLKSPDGLNWTKISESPIIQDYAFDSQNTLFWDQVKSEYRTYFRHSFNGFRQILTARSTNLSDWSNFEAAVFEGGPLNEHLYTNAVHQYYRAPELYIGFPTRYFDSTEGGDDSTEPLLMTSYDGFNFKKWDEPLIEKTAPEDREGNRSNYMQMGMLELPSEPGKISMYASENYAKVDSEVRLRRFVYRVDGFVALKSGETGGIFVTKPLSYQGTNLLLNYKVDSGGELKVEVLDNEENVIGESIIMTDDQIDGTVNWLVNPNLSSGTVQLRFTLKNASIFSFKFSS